MKQDVNFCQFCNALRSMDRNENFSYSAKRLLFDYLEDEAENSGQEYNIESEDEIEDYLQENTLLIGETKEGFLFASF